MKPLLAFFVLNKVPAGIIILATCLGYFFGHTVTGFVLGVALVSLVNLMPE